MKKVCPECGEEIIGNNILCNKCRDIVRHEHEDLADDAASKASKSVLIIGCIVIVLFVATLVFILLAYGPCAAIEDDSLQGMQQNDMPSLNQ